MFNSSRLGACVSLTLDRSFLRTGLVSALFTDTSPMSGFMGMLETYLWNE